MRRFAKWLATHAFGVGLAIGTLAVPHAAKACLVPVPNHSRPVADVSFEGVGNSTEDGDLTDYIKVQEDIRDVLFAADAEGSSYYVLDSFPTTDSDFAIGGYAHLGARFQLDVVSAQAIPSVSTDPNWVAGGGRASYVIGVMRNIAGASIDIAAVVFDLKDETGARRNFMFPMATIGTVASETIPLRALRFSTPGSIVRGQPDGARTPGADPNCQQTTNDQEKCICLAQLNYDECVRNAKVNNLICVGACLASMAAALAVCAIQAVVPGLGWLTGGACALGVIAAAAICVNACTAWYLLNGMVNCREQFRIALVGCGIYW